MNQVKSESANNYIRPIGIDLFCGAGGMSLGFEQAGFDVRVAIDINPIHVSTHANNFPNSQTLCADLSTISGDEIRGRSGLCNETIDVLFGGTPCQGFSSGGKQDPGDPRNLQLNSFARLVLELRPSYFVLENVEALLHTKFESVVNCFFERLNNDYAIMGVWSLNANQFGVPQRRKRVFIIGGRKSLPIPTQPISIGNKESVCPTVWDAISDLPDVDSIDYLLTSDVYRGTLHEQCSLYAKVLRNEAEDPIDRSRRVQRPNLQLTGCYRTNHSDEVVLRFRNTKPGTQEPVSRFFRLPKDGFANTLRAGTDSANGSFTAPRPIHPISPRCITVREAARLHSFPDWFDFHPTKWHGFRQIGNSVPPYLARAVAKNVIKMLI